MRQKIDPHLCQWEKCLEDCQHCHSDSLEKKELNKLIVRVTKEQRVDRVESRQ